MAKAVDSTTVLDAALNGVAACNIQHICSAQPANYAGIAAVSLGSVSMTPVTNYTLAAGDSSGRKVTVAAKSGVSVGTTGTATHLVLALTTDSTLRLVTTCASQAVTAGGTVDIPAWKWEIQSPS
jgi:hypothetical protein